MLDEHHTCFVEGTEVFFSAAEVDFDFGSFFCPFACTRTGFTLVFKIPGNARNEWQMRGRSVAQEMRSSTVEYGRLLLFQLMECEWKVIGRLPASVTSVLSCFSFELEILVLVLLL